MSEPNLINVPTYFSDLLSKAEKYMAEVEEAWQQNGMDARIQTQPLDLSTRLALEGKQFAEAALLHLRHLTTGVEWQGVSLINTSELGRARRSFAASDFANAYDLRIHALVTSMEGMRPPTSLSDRADLWRILGSRGTVPLKVRQNALLKAIRRYADAVAYARTACIMNCSPAAPKERSEKGSTAEPTAEPPTETTLPSTDDVTNPGDPTDS